MTAPGGRSLWVEGAAVAALYAIVLLALAHPLSLRPGTHVLYMGADTNLLLWTMAWDAHALAHAPLAIFDANIFHPFRNTLAYSENMIGSAIIAAPVLWASGNPVLALNVVSLLSCVLCGVGVYVLARRLRIGPFGAALAGLIFAFAPPRFLRLGQLHLTTVQWVPFCLAFAHGYLDSGRRRDLWWACAFFALQVLTSGHGAVFAALSLAALILWRLALGEPVRERLRDLALPATLTLAIAAAVFFPYHVVQREMGLRRPLEESYAFSPNLASFIASPSHLHAHLLGLMTDGAVLQDARANLFPGYLALALALAGVWAGVSAAPRTNAVPARSGIRRAALVLEIALAVSLLVAVAASALGGFRWRYGSTTILSVREAWRPWALCAVLLLSRLALARSIPLNVRARAAGFGPRYRHWSERQRRNDLALYSLLALISLWLSLGPAFGLYRLVYDWPGISFIRVPSRFTIVTLLALAVLAAAGFEHLSARLVPRTRAVLALAAGLVLVAEYFAAPLNARPYAVTIPPVDRWLDTRPKPFVVAELPLPASSSPARQDLRQSVFMLHSMAHFQKTVHGYSGFQPEFHVRLYERLQAFPDERSLAALERLGVTFVVIHEDLYPPEQWREVEGRLRGSGGWLTLEHAGPGGRVYSLRPRPSRPE
ncbi:MAG TPA: hypothetical protein VK886_13205 [Vicinamibacterales bacterium]|nr:hypothetical protein [Vicinamibacterales bacterium]